MNRRIQPRLHHRLKLSLGKGLHTFTADVSPGGFAAELMEVVPPGTRVHGSLEMQGNAFDFTGVVCWAKEGEPRLGLRGRIGVRFESIANAFFEQFQKVLRPTRNSQR